MAIDWSPVSTATPAEAETEPLDPAFIKLAVILLVGVVMVVFDSTIINVAIDVLARGLHTSVSNGQWTITGYVLALAMVVPVAGWASDRFGAKQVWMAAEANITQKGWTPEKAADDAFDQIKTIFEKYTIT